MTSSINAHLLSPETNKNDAYSIMYGTYDYYAVLSNLSGGANEILPTAFLKSNVEITGGTGAIDDPYIAALP